MACVVQIRELIRGKILSLESTAQMAFFTMAGKSIVVGVMLVMTLASVSAAGDLIPHCLRCDKECCPCESQVCARPNDYCGKCPPCATGCLPCTRCNDYFRKGIPCVSCLPQMHRCNDYCRKPFPAICGIKLLCPGCPSSCGEAEPCAPR